VTIVLSLRGDRSAADGPFFALLIMAAGLVLGLLGLVVHYLVSVQRVVDACRETWVVVMAHGQPLSGLMPLTVASLIVLLALFSLVRQWIVTQRLLGRLLARRLEAPRALATLARRLGLGDRLDYVDDDAAYAFCYGLLRPRICVSRGLVELLDAHELEAVLRHEQHHLLHHDPLKILLSRALAAGLFFLPVAGELRNRYLAVKEITADEGSAHSGDRGKVVLASALLKLIKAAPQSWPEGLAAIGSFNVTQERVQRLVNGYWSGTPFPRLRTVVISLLLIAAIFLVSYAPLMAQQAAPFHDECLSEAALLYLPR